MTAQALLSVTFGTSYEDTRKKTIDVVEARLREAFPDRAFYSAWTSGRIISKLENQRGEHHDTLEEACARMSSDGIDEVVVATMCLMRGAEWAKIDRALRSWLKEDGRRSAKLAEPLMAGEGDRNLIARCLRGEFSHVGADEVLLLMGHGSSLARNDAYASLRDEFVSIGCERFFVATVEGTPTLDDVMNDVLSCNPACVHLSPLMMVAGDHATNDLAGDGADSWRSVLEAHGLRTQVVMRGLGEYEDIQRLVCDHARDALPLE